MLAGFNSSMWHAFVVLGVPGAAASSYVLQRAWKRQQWFHYFDPKHNSDAALRKEGSDFGPHWSHYEGLAKLVISLSVGAIAFIINTLVHANESPSISDFDRKIAAVAPIVVGFFGAAIFLLIAFLLWLAFRYEEYCHAPNHDSYSAWMYAATVSMGVMGFLAFVLGFVWLGANLFG